jgi:hypothetical protein
MSCILPWGKSHVLKHFFGHSRPTSLQDRGRDSDDEDFRDRDYDVAALASNLSQAFKYGIHSNEDVDDEVSILLLFFTSVSISFLHVTLLQGIANHL